MLIWMGIIFYFSSRVRVAVSDTYAWNFLFFKSLHVIEYAVLTLLVYRGVFFSWPRLSHIRLLLIVVLMALVYAISDEFHQTFVSTREGSIRDIGIDLIGITLAIGYTKLYWQSFKYIFLRV